MGAASYTGTLRAKKTVSTQDAVKDRKASISHCYQDTDFETGLVNSTGVIEVHRAKSKENANQLMENIFVPGDILRVGCEELDAAVGDKGGPCGAIRYPLDKEFDEILIFGFFPT